MIASNRRSYSMFRLAVALSPLILVPGVQAYAAGLLVPAYGGAPLAIEEHLVKVDINNGIAVTEVTQVFRNDSADPLEAVYTFPLPPGASLSGFSMWINGEEMAGEVLEKNRAREIYEEIVHPFVESAETARVNGGMGPIKDPGLVEEVSYREFRVTVFPVQARGTQKVRLTYYEHLTTEDDRVVYVYPLETRAPEDAHVTGRLLIDVTLRSSVPIVDHSFPSGFEEEFVSEVWNKHHIRAVLDRSDRDLDRDFVMAYRLGRGSAGLDVVTFRKPGEDGYFLLLATAPVSVDDGHRDPVDYTFLVDVSGSMRGRNRLSLVSMAIDRFMESCGPDDRFNLIAFNVTPQPFSARAVPNGREERSRIRRFLGDFRGVGGTDLHPALKNALDLADHRRKQAIVVISDGGLNDLDEDHGRFLNLLTGTDTTIFSLAVGNEANVPLLETLASATGGFVARLSSQEDLEARGSQLRERMIRSPWRQMTLAADGDAFVYDFAPGRVADLFPGAQVAVLGRYSGHGATTFRLDGFRNGEPVTLSTTVDMPSRDRLNPEIRRMWAENRVEEVLQGMRAGRLPGRETRTIVSLGEDHSIVTPFTSFLVLENEEMFRRYGIERRSHALLEEERESREARVRLMDGARASIPSQRTPGPSLDFGGALDPWFGVAALLLVSCALLAGRFCS